MKDVLRKAPALVFALVAIVLPLAAQRNDPATQPELDAITSRGRMLAEYDTAAWHSTDAVAALSPREGSIARYVAKKSTAGWVVGYGRLNEKRDRFLVVYEAVQGATPREFKVTKHEPPREDAGFYLSGALALETALADFKGLNRPYNAAVIPAPNDQMWVYVMPAQTKADVWPLGGDVRYLISKDGSRIIEKRQLHNTILENPPPQKGQTIVMGFHTAVIDNVPEDTDVFHVLTREPSAPQMIATRKFVYQIKVDGSILYLGTVEKILGVKK